MRRVGLTVGVVLALVLAGAVVYLRPIAPIATGYAAQIVCGAHHLQGRTVEDASGDLPANPLVPFLRISADDDGVDATLLGLSGSRAQRVPGAGCRLVGDDPIELTSVPPVEAGVDDLLVPDDSTAAAAAAGLDVDVLTAALDAALGEDGVPEGAVRGTRAVVVVHGGQVVAERYADGFDADTPLLGWSMSKSIAQAMVGRLVLDGRLELGDTDLRLEWAGDERSTITLEQLLQMRSGLAFDEVYAPPSDATRMLFVPGPAGLFAAQQPLVAEPGTDWSYSSGTTNIVCDLVADVATETPPQALATELVFGPLSMTSAIVGTDVTGRPVCSSFGYATAHDWARFGQWYLQDGVWGGERLLPEGWVEHASTPVPVPTGEGDDVTPYGAHWWLNLDAEGRVRFPGIPEDAFWASGNEGQQVVVLPSHDTVVVRLGLSSGLGSTDWGLEALVGEAVRALP